MNNLKKITLASLIIAPLASSSFAAEYEMRLSHQFPPSHLISKIIDDFAVAVEKNTRDKVDVQIFGSSQLYKPNQVHAAVASGQIESAGAVNFQWGGTVPEMNVTSIPYLITDMKKIAKFPNSEAAQFLNNKLKEKGVVNLAWLTMSTLTAMTSNNHPIISPSDFKGLKIRGLNKIVDAGVKEMQASPIVMSGSEVYQALQTGIVDASFTDVGAAWSRRYFEVQKYITVTPMNSVYFNLFVNPKWYDALPQDVKDGINSAAVAAEKESNALILEENEHSLVKLQEAGVELHLHTADEQDALKSAMQPAVLKAFRESADDADELLGLINKL